MTTSGPLRIGDAERDSAAAALSEHYASGRLTKAEYDERLEAVWAAKYEADVGEVFSDLPGPHGAVEVRQDPERVATPGGSDSFRRRFMQGAPMFLAAPLMLVLFGAVLFAVLRGAPWLLFVALWFFMCGGFGHTRRHRHHRHRHQHRHA
ncbi:DUF1707 SHOCT-like domain-containing protein [Phytoactinopolyspora halotolerans]|uniref:DUF1707 domain-containing protein n=1 Tax=Phytoactinopolyspora halotolerans TaxID=1981512 RepID=A0A6L9S516_9ACTN|nr:DUF1707 domain-containing protein [Phytoactinopolyspora halotolerans]NED99139.1 DUF1707 domain-containing protein [Phytoactinopolyspora halotolerans]